MSSVKEFISIYNTVTASEIDEESEIDGSNSYRHEFVAKEILSRALVTFVNGLGEDGKKLMSLNIISKFAENKSLEKIKRAKALYTIYSRKLLYQKLLNKREKLKSKIVIY